MLCKKRFTPSLVNHHEISDANNKLYCFICKKSTHLKKNCRYFKRAIKNTKIYQVQDSTFFEPIILKGTVKKQHASFILDTGSGASLIDVKFVPINKISNTKFVRVKSASGNFLWIVGESTLKFKINNVQLEHKFLVVKNFENKIILGNDFNKQFKTDINFLTDSIKIAINDKKYYLKGANKEKFADVHVTEDNVLCAAEIILPPLSTTKVPICYLNKNKSVLNFECRFEFFNNRGSLVSKVKLDNFVIYVTNLTNTRVTIFKGSNLGKVNELRIPHNEQLIAMKNDLDYSDLVSESKCNVIRKFTVSDNFSDLNLNKDLSKTEYVQLSSLLKEFSDIFATNTLQLGRTDVCKQTIETGDARPIHQPPYRVSYKEREIINQQIGEMLNANIISESRSPWASPVVLVKKKNGDWRFCVDYRKLNNVIKSDSYPLPVIDDILKALNGSTYFTTLDLFSGYWQIGLDEKDKDKTAFIVPDGLYEFNVLPFGLSSSPACFQRCMDQVLAGLKWNTCLVYLDDVLVKGSTFADHLLSLRKVLERFRQANLKLNSSKCFFGFNETKILGHVASSRGISPDPDKIAAISKFPRPQKVKDVQSFIGLANYYRKFIKSFADIARPLTLLTRRSYKFEWNGVHQNAFDELKSKLVTYPVLRHFDPNLPTEIHTDASDYGIGAIILQTDQEGTHPIAYASRRLSSPEIKYNTTHKECLAVVYAVTYFRHYLWGRPFKIVVDHHALCWLHKNKDPAGRLARWAIKLQDFQYEIVHKSGKKHLDADSLSRNPVFKPEYDATEIPTMLMEFDDIAKLQSCDPELNQIINAIKNPSNADAKVLKRTRSYLLENSILYKKHFSPNSLSKLLVIPDCLKNDVLLCFHDDPVSGAHLGFAKTYGKIKNRYFWPNMYTEIENYVKTCIHCQHRKNVPKAEAGLLQPIKVDQPFQKLGIDLLGPFPKSHSGNTFVITAMCYATKWAEAKALPTGTAKCVAEFLIENIICRHGCPEQIISDRGKCFMSNLVTELLKGLGSHPTFTTAYHPKTNGLVEHFNGTIATMLSMYVSTNQRDWDIFVPLVTFAYNTSPQESTKESPFYLTYGREARLPIDVVLGANINRDQTAEEMLTRIKKSREAVKQRIHAEQKKQKLKYDSRHRHVDYEVGEKVMVFTPIRKIGKSEKLLHRWFGPYSVIKKLNDVNYKVRVRKNRNSVDDTIHVSRMKKFNERNSK